MKTKQLPQGWKEKPFLECLEKEASNNKLKIPQKDFLEEGIYPIIDQGDNVIAGYTDDETKVYSEKLPVVVFGDHTRVFKFVKFPFAIGADGTKILVPIKELNPKFFYYMLRKLNLPSAGYSRHYKFLKEKSLVIPLLETQQKIVSILEKAEQLKEKRKKSIEVLDEYLKVVFSEMFLKKKFEEVELGKGILKTENKNPEKEFPEEYFNYIDISSINNHSKKIIDIKKILGKDAPSRAKQLVKNKDILISTVRPNLNAVAIVPKELDNQICSTGYCIIRADNKTFISEYLFFVSRSRFFIDSLIKKTRGANYPAVSDRDVKSTKIPLPPLALQQKFASIVKYVEELKEKQKKSQEEIEELFGALMQKAFQGELVR